MGAFRLKRFLHNATIPAGMTLGLKTFARAPVVDSTLAAAINSVPSGNSLTLSTSAALPVRMSLADSYVPGTSVVPAPNLTFYTGAGGSGYASWTEDGNARTMTPDKSAAQGNGTGALGDQTRVNGKPTCGLATTWFQVFHGRLMLFISAEAEADIAKVRVYSEGAYIDLTQKKFVTYRGNGKRWGWFYGYICELDSPNYTGVGSDISRTANVYVRAYSNDGTFETQLTSVYPFYPVSSDNTCFDYLIEVTPSLSAATYVGGTYPSVNMKCKTLIEAFSYVAGSAVAGHTVTGGMKRPRIIVTETCFLNQPNVSSTYTGLLGWCVIEAAAGVTAKIGKTPFSNVFGGTGGGFEWSWNIRVDYVCFRGPGVLIDNTNMETSRQNIWGDGCGTTSDVDFTQNVGPHGRPMGPIGFAWQTDCELMGSFGAFWVNRCNFRYNVSNADVYDHNCVVFGDTVKAADSRGLRNPRPAMTITYTGAAAPSLNKIGANGSPSGTFQCVENGSSVVVSVALQQYFTTYSDVVTAINTYGNGWSAVLEFTPGDRYYDVYVGFASPAGTGTGPSTSSAWADTMVAGVPYTVRSYMDVHLDMFQTQQVADTNKQFNCIQFWDCYLQVLYDNGVNPSVKDCSYKNIFADNTTDGAIKFQLNSATHEHLMMEWWSDGLRPVNFGNDTMAWWADQKNSFFRNSVFNNLTWTSTANATAYPHVDSNHFSTAYAKPTNNVGSGNTSGGSYDTWYPNHATYDAAPGGALLTNLVTAGPNQLADATGVMRSGSVPKGGTTVGLADGATLTKAQALELHAISGGNVSGSCVLTWKDGPSNTGSTRTFTVTFAAA